VSFRQASL